MSDTEQDAPHFVGSKKTVKVGILMEYTVEVEVPPNADLGEQADHELFVRNQWDDYDEKDVLNTRILDEEPLFEDDFESMEDWPTHV